MQINKNTRIVLFNSFNYHGWRSPSDGFYDSGLWVIKSHLDSKGIGSQIFDWTSLREIKKFLPAKELSKRAADLALKMKNGQMEVLKDYVLLQNEINSLMEDSVMHEVDELIDCLKKSNTKVFGIKSWYGNAWLLTKEIIGRVKRACPNILVVIGGPQVNIYKELTLRHSEADFAVASQGEELVEKMFRIMENNKKETAIELISEMADNEKLPNLYYRQGDKVGFTGSSISRHWPIPDYQSSSGKMPIHSLSHCFGCTWAKCNFCTHGIINDGCYVERELSEVMKEIKAVKDLGIKFFQLSASDTPYVMGKRFAEKLLDDGIKIFYSIFSRAVRGAKYKYHDIVAAYVSMINSGLRAIFMGTESGNDFVNLNIMNKGVNSDDVRLTIQAIRQAEEITGIKTIIGLAFIYPVPLPPGSNVSLEEVKEDNIGLVESVKPDVVLVTPPGPFPGTDWFINDAKWGFVMNKDHFAKDCMEYEYLVYLPAMFWPDLNLSLDIRERRYNFKELISEADSLRKYFSSEGYVMDMGSEQTLIALAAGFGDKLQEFKNLSSMALLSRNYDFFDQIINLMYGGGDN